MAEVIPSSDNTPFHRFMYNLFYPAILGSMLYATLSPGACIQIVLFRIGIILFFIVDYLFLYEVFNSDEDSTTFESSLDFVIAVFLGLSHALLGDHGERMLFSYLFLSLTTIIFVVYVGIFKNKKATEHILGYVALCLLSVLSFSFYAKSGYFWIIFIQVGFYIVFFVYVVINQKNLHYLNKMKA